MESMFVVIFFVLGLVFGSFFNVIGLRLPKNQTFTNDHSKCPYCQQRLSWIELVPVFSFIMQGGKCSYCKKRISMIYPIGECATGVLFAFSFMQIGFHIELLTALLFISMLMIILISDIKYMLIPDKVLLFFLPLFITLRYINPLEPWWLPILGAIVPFIMIAVIIFVSRGGMGAGDMKLFGITGIVLGLKKVLLAFFLSCVIGAVIGMILLFCKKISRSQPFPFGPYIIIATLISYYFGDKIITWYFTFF